MNRAPEIKKQAAMLRQFFADEGVKLTHRQSLDRVAKLRGYPSWQVMEKQLRTSPAKEEGLTPGATGTYDKSREIAIIWGIGDVLAVRPDLSDDQCMEVLANVHQNQDAERGVNWDVISDAAENMFGAWHVEAQFRAEGESLWETVTVCLSNGAITCIAKEEYLAADDHLDFVTEGRAGELRFAELPDETFEVEDGSVAGEAGDLADIADSLRGAGAVYDGRTRPKDSWFD